MKKITEMQREVNEKTFKKQVGAQYIINKAQIHAM